MNILVACLFMILSLSTTMLTSHYRNCLFFFNLIVFMNAPRKRARCKRTVVETIRYVIQSYHIYISKSENIILWYLAHFFVCITFMS